MSTISSEVSILFRTRDKAVAKKGRPLFLSTQVSEIQGGSSRDYLALESMKTEVLCEYNENELEKIVFAKETYKYSPNGKEPYSSFPVYSLTNTVKGWKIYKVK